MSEQVRATLVVLAALATALTIIGALLLPYLQTAVALGGAR
jgi:hypothetical protein